MFENLSLTSVLIGAYTMFILNQLFVIFAPRKWVNALADLENSPKQFALAAVLSFLPVALSALINFWPLLVDAFGRLRLSPAAKVLGLFVVVLLAIAGIMWLVKLIRNKLSSS